MYFLITKWKNVIKVFFTSLIRTIFKHISIKKKMRLKYVSQIYSCSLAFLCLVTKIQTMKVMKSCLRYLIRLIDEASEPPKDCGNFMFWYFFCNVFFLVFRGHVAGFYSSKIWDHIFKTVFFLNLIFVLYFTFKDF